MSNFSSSDFAARIESAMVEGKMARDDLIRQIAQMNSAQIASLPPAVLSILGADGLSAIARRRGEFAHLAPRQPPYEAEPTDVSFEQNKRRVNRWMVTFVSASVVLISTTAFDILRPRLMAWLRSGDRPQSIATWPTCERLDPYVDGCIYAPPYAGLSMERAAFLLALPTNELGVINRHIPPDQFRSLPPNTRLVVWRGNYRLLERK